ncbi:MAG: aminotransferase class IV [Acidimicrobiia bacterium]
MTEQTILINGEESAGTVPVMDSSVLRGDGCFEVLKSYGGRPFTLEEHLDRLTASAAALELPIPNRDDLRSWVNRVSEECGDCAVRIVLTRGSSVPGQAGEPLTIVFAHPWEAPRGPVRLGPVMAPWHAAGIDWDLAGAKILSYAPNLAATRRAVADGFGDALLLSRDGTILEGPTFSIAWAVGDVLETPALSLGILDSITRRVVLDLARNAGIAVVEGSWTLDRLDEADEVMAMSTIREVQPVSAVGERQFGEGPVTSRLARLFAQLVE